MLIHGMKYVEPKEQILTPLRKFFIVECASGGPWFAAEPLHNMDKINIALKNIEL